MSLESILASQAAALAVGILYLLAFRKAFCRQAAALRHRPALSLALGLLVCAAWLLPLWAASRLGPESFLPAALTILRVPLYLALAAGGAICLALLAGILLRWDLEAHPYRCLLAGQVLAVAIQVLPGLGAPLATVYGAAGLGAVALSEWRAARENPPAPRLGYIGLLSLLLASALLSWALLRSSARLSQEASELAAPGPQPITVLRR
ncbi:MAG: hypothetical protein KGO96_11045 [Elusimicrobia bacterium]|nr:hypothetical protein [Elusimicrobiota bacterium]MDE2236811.1 hypothetical protein [Elusimicrobiota bacterium]MDE2426428.1 hypothetical protein [Elusimicrobiota bacterium]